METLPEVWQRGPLDAVPALLQPVAHALLQAREEIAELEPEINEDNLWKRPANMASVGFHLQHLSGVLDRVFTYARNESLTEEQLNQLRDEDMLPGINVTATSLVTRFNHQVDFALNQIKNTNPTTLTDFRAIGRKQLPSTVIGLLVHAAEHTMRHLGQLIVTLKILNSQ